LNTDDPAVIGPFGGIAVTLTGPEIEESRRVAQARAQRLATDAALAARAWVTATDEVFEQVGAERAFTRWFELDWAPEDLHADGTARIATDTHIRWSTSDRLVIYDADPDDDRYVLVRGSAPTFEICGWESGREMKSEPAVLAPTGSDVRRNSSAGAQLHGRDVLRVTVSSDALAIAAQRADETVRIELLDGPHCSDCSHSLLLHSGGPAGLRTPFSGTGCIIFVNTYGCVGYCRCRRPSGLAASGLSVGR